MKPYGKVLRQLKTRIVARAREDLHEVKKGLTDHDRIELEEGRSLVAYIDTTGNVTIGFGHNLGKLILASGALAVPPAVRLIPVNGITEEIADMLLDAKLISVRDALTKALPWGPKLAPARWSVLLDLAFNMGVPKLVDGWPNFLENVRNGQYVSAAGKMKSSLWYSQVHARRADPLIEMMLTGRDA